MTNYTDLMHRIYETTLINENSVSLYNWMYEDGVLLKAMEATGSLFNDTRWIPFLETYVNAFVTEDGEIPFVKKRPPSVDCLNNGKVIWALYHQLPLPKYKNALEYLREKITTHPRLDHCAGFAHKAVYSNQMWLDGLFMLQPLYAEYTKEWGPSQCFDDIARQFALITKFAYDKEKQLYYHAYDHSRSMFWANKETGTSPHFWGRAMGWLSMAAVDCLDYFPADHPGRKPILEVITNIAEGIVRYQSPSGVWYQILDMAEREGNYKESSCSCMFTYFLIKSVQMGYLPSTYLAYAYKAMEGVLKEFVTIDEQGNVHIHNVCLVAGLGPAKKPERDGSFAYYISEPVVSDDNKAFGPFLHALTRFAMEEMSNETKTDK